MAAGAPVPDPRPPMVIPGYDNLTLIGRGGFAHVYRARQEGFDRDVAVKVLLVSLDDDRDRRRFERECAAMGRLTGHPHIVTVLESGVTPDGNPYLTTPFYGNGTLADRLQIAGPFSITETLATGVALAGALELAHTNGILHRDVKPANVLLSAYGEPALADFGIAVIAESGDLSQVTHAFTITHAPPEILDGRRATEATDVYSLASTLWTMLTGAPPFGDDDGQGLAARVQRVQHDPVPRLALPDAPESLESALRSALAKRPEDRPATARELGERLRDVQRERGDEVTPLRIGPVAAVGSAVASPAQGPSPTGTVAWAPGDAVRWADDGPASAPAPPAPLPPLPTSVLPTPPAPPPPPPTSVMPATATEIPRPAVRIEPPPPARPGRATPTLPLLAAAAVIVVIGLLAGLIVASRAGDEVVATAPASAPPTEPETTATTVVAAPPSVAPSTAPPSTTAPAQPGPATAVVPDDAPGSVRRAATIAQDGANALAAGDWATARRLIPSLAGASDASLTEAWGALDRSTLVVTDWQEASNAPGGDDGNDKDDDEKTKSAGGVIALRLGQVAHERDGDGTRTSLYCVTWAVQGTTVVSMADQQVVAAPWRSGAADPAAAASVLADSCRGL